MSENKSYFEGEERMGTQ